MNTTLFLGFFDASSLGNARNGASKNYNVSSRLARVVEAVWDAHLTPEADGSPNPLSI